MESPVFPPLFEIVNTKPTLGERRKPGLALLPLAIPLTAIP